MKNKLLKLSALLMALLILGTFALVSCSHNESNDNADDTSEAKSLDKNLEIKIYALNGTTALGMSQMIVNAKNGTDDMNYKIELFPSADLISASIVSGECAIAALPTNAAAKLYKKSEGKLQLLALNTLGVLYLLDNTNSVTALNNLKGKTVYLPGKGSNPEYITAALLEGAGLKIGTDVTLDTTTYPSPDALQAAVIAKKVDYAVLPEPKVSIVTTKNSEVNVALDLTEEWEKIYGENTLVQGCLVVNKAFAEKHPLEVKKFLEDYKASVDFISEGSDKAVSTVVEAGVLPQAPIAKKALPKCNLCCITGNDMKPAINVFYEKLYAIDPQSIVAVPDDGFYYVSK